MGGGGDLTGALHIQVSLPLLQSFAAAPKTHNGLKFW